MGNWVGPKGHQFYEPSADDVMRAHENTGDPRFKLENWFDIEPGEPVRVVIRERKTPRIVVDSSKWTGR